jgi:hypothetical protein
MKQLNVFGRMLNLPRGFELIERTTGSGHAAFVMALAFGVLAVLTGTLFWVYDLHSTWVVTYDYINWIAESGRLPTWLAVVIRDFLRYVAVLAPSLLQFALADEDIRSHPAFAWVFVAAIGFDFVTDAPAVCADVDRFLAPVLVESLGVFSTLAVWVSYVLATVIASTALQTVTTVFALGAVVAWGRRTNARNTRKHQQQPFNA